MTETLEHFILPLNKYHFNRNLNHNDGLLIGKISETLKVNYGDARNLVENFTIDLRRKLDKGEKVVFDEIGIFINNQEGNVLFEPDRNVNYHLDSYGLESFQCMPLEGYDVRTRIIRSAQKDPLRQASMRKLLWRAAVIIPLLIVLVAVPLKTDLFKAKIATTTLNPLVSAEFEDNKNALDKDRTDAPEKEMSGALDNNRIAETPKVEENAPPAIEEVPVTESIAPVATENKGYCVITGSFKSEENAVFQVNKLKEDGFIPEIIPGPNGFFRVSAIICSDFGTAVLKKDSISKKYRNSWVSRKK